MAEGLEPGERTRRRVQDAVEGAAEADPEFGALVEALVARLEEVQQNAPSDARFGLRGAQGIQRGNYSTQTNTFN